MTVCLPCFGFGGIQSEEMFIAHTDEKGAQGSISIGVTANGFLSEATIQIFNSGTNEMMTSVRTDTSFSQNPVVIVLPTGKYDIVIQSEKILGKPLIRKEGVLVAAGKVISVEHDFPFGEISIHSIQNGERSDSRIIITVKRADEYFTAGQRLYKGDGSHAYKLALVPGSYEVEMMLVTAEDSYVKRAVLIVEEGESISHTFAW